MSSFCIRWVSSLLLAVSLAAQAANVHIAHCYELCPERNTGGSEIVVRHLFAAAIDPGTGLPEWVAYRILPDGLGVASLLTRTWQVDRLVRTEAAAGLTGGDGREILQAGSSVVLDNEYRVIGGADDSENPTRLAPMTSFAGTPYWEELNYLSNMAALPADLRLGSWARLEMAINELVPHYSPLYVLAGPIAEPRGGFFKVVRSGSAVAAFVFSPDLPRHAGFCGQAGTLQSIESGAGLRLFPAPGGADAESMSSLLPALGCSNASGKLP